MKAQSYDGALLGRQIGNCPIEPIVGFLRDHRRSWIHPLCHELAIGSAGDVTRLMTALQPTEAVAGVQRQKRRLNGRRKDEIYRDWGDCQPMSFASGWILRTSEKAVDN